MDLVVGDRDRLAQAVGDRAGLALEAGAQHRQRDVRRLAAGGLAADAVDDDEEAAGGVAVKAILVDLALQAGVGGAGGAQALWIGDRERRRQSLGVPARPRRSTPHERRRAPPAARNALQSSAS